MNNRQLYKSLKPVLGVECWKPKQGFGSFLSFQFGLPQISPPLKSQGKARIHGRYQLSVLQCVWEIWDDGNKLAWSESERSEIETALKQLDGQQLSSVDMDDGCGAFNFGESAQLLLWRYEDYEVDDDLWTLFRPESSYSYLANDQISFNPRTKE